ncbi:30S ribosomal protein S12 methylthiotransferase RimO [uncultured Helicobacter sp.]|uniref:30S ribosomal protein S12 methylthiotransferase RimO n=1 Tax=uncultured Helicobacter sp. TaxID=175537 RepID=UPI00374EFD0C
MTRQLHLISLGCTKNLVDSEVMLGKLATYDITQDLGAADVIIVNTCGFIESAKQESIATILEASANRKEGALLVVSGCLSERYYNELREQIPEIDIITGVGDYDKIDEMIESRQSRHSPRVFLADELSERVITNSSFHSYIKLSEGCNQKCSFCAIPSFKGRLHSRTLDSVIKELEILYAKGFRDFSFVAQDSSSFLRDVGVRDGLIQLIRRIDSLQLPITARLLYLYPSTTSLELIESIANSRTFLPYFDMPIQHITDSMLKIMNRGANRTTHEKLIESMDKIKGRFMRTSLIIGHPGESEEDFRQLCAFVEQSPFDRINLFEYSPQEGTASFTLPKIESKVITKRIRTLNAIIQAKQKASLDSLLGQNLEVIVEGVSEVSEYFYSARARLWAREIDGEILINDRIDSLGAIEPKAYLCEVTQIKDDFVFGKLIAEA